MQKPRGQALIDAWDPYFFRAKLNKPKLVIDATGDDYWSLRAFDQYADELPGTTNLLMVPGTDHYMVSAIGQIMRASTAWCRWTLNQKPLPQPQLTRRGNKWRSFAASGAQSAILYWAWSRTNDFREAKWQNRPMRKTSAGSWTAATSPAPTGKNVLAVFAQGRWQGEKQSLPLGSRVIIRPDGQDEKEITAG